MSEYFWTRYQFLLRCYGCDHNDEIYTIKKERIEGVAKKLLFFCFLLTVLFFFT